jgi:hypothetical protein
MPIESPTFGVHLSNVPIINLRGEFKAHYRLARDRKLIPTPGTRIAFQTPYLLWKAMPDSGATLVLVRTLLSVEAYVSFAAEFAGAEYGLLSSDFKRACRNPFELGRRGTANSYYNLLPALIDAKLAMRAAAPVTWVATKAFYKEIRNPLFHGHQLSDVTADRYATLFEQVANIYRWVDAWYDPEKVVKGAGKAFAFD